MPNLREQIQIARVNRMKRRAALAWHVRNCPRCAAGGTATVTRFDGSVSDLFRMLSELPTAMDDEPAPQAKHTH